MKYDISSHQCRAARSLLNWTQDDLEGASGVAKKTIADFERGARSPRIATLKMIRDALELGGVDFVNETPSKGGGVRFRYSRSHVAHAIVQIEKDGFVFVGPYKNDDWVEIDRPITTEKLAYYLKLMELEGFSGELHYVSPDSKTPITVHGGVLFDPNAYDADEILKVFVDSFS